MPFFPVLFFFFSFPVPSLKPIRKKPRSGSVPPSLGFPTPSFERGQAIYLFTSGRALFATRGPAAILFFFSLSYCEGAVRPGHAAGLLDKISWRKAENPGSSTENFSCAFF